MDENADVMTTHDRAKIDSEAKEKANILNYVSTRDMIMFGGVGIRHCLHR
jgi:hypothetical protein